MKNKFKLLIVLIFNYFFVSSCNHISSGDKDFGDSLKSNSALSCQSLSEKVPRRYIKTASIVNNELFVFSQRSNSTMDASRFDLDSLDFKGLSNFSNANSIKEFEKGLLLETNDSTVIMVGDGVYHVDFPSDKVRYFERFQDFLFVLIDKGQYSELYKIDPSKKKSYFLKRVNLDYSDVRFSESGGIFSMVFVSEKRNSAHFESYIISGDKAKVAKYKIERAEIIDWDINLDKQSLSIFMIAADDFYSDKQYLIRVGMNFKENKKIREIRREYNDKNYDSLKISNENDKAFILLESDESEQRSLDFFGVSTSFSKLGSRVIMKKRAYIRQWKKYANNSYFVFSSVSPLGDKYYICK
jgi:hypothetical protein